MSLRRVGSTIATRANSSHNLVASRGSDQRATTNAGRVRHTECPLRGCSPGRSTDVGHAKPAHDEFVDFQPVDSGSAYHQTTDGHHPRARAATDWAQADWPSHRRRLSGMWTARWSKYSVRALAGFAPRSALSRELSVGQRRYFAKLVLWLPWTRPSVPFEARAEPQKPVFPGLSTVAVPRFAGQGPTESPGTKKKSPKISRVRRSNGERASLPNWRHSK
jgi:hypothetical protein